MRYTTLSISDLITIFSLHFYSADGAISYNKSCSIISLRLTLKYISNTILSPSYESWKYVYKYLFFHQNALTKIAI